MPEYLSFRIKYHSVKVCRTSILERKNLKDEHPEVQGHGRQSTTGKPCEQMCIWNSSAEGP